VTQRVVRANGVELCVETFGAAGDPALLLIGGAGGAMDWWDDALCQRIADGLRFVIRYDLRDTGRSTSYPPGAPAYGLDDLADDAASLLTSLRVAVAHVVGISMGGTIALKLALRHPPRVATLTLMSTSPAGPSAPDLPPMSARLRQALRDTPPPDWRDRSAAVQHGVDAMRPFAGSAGFDEARVRATVQRVHDRTPDIATLTHHWQIEGGEPVRPQLGCVPMPTLVVHGTDDPLFPIGHGEALARELPQAHLLRLPGVGHEMPPPASWDVFVPALLRHTSGGWEQQADRLAARAQARGDATAWFQQIYDAAGRGEVDLPWSRTTPHPLLHQWAQQQRLNGSGQRAIVVGCGLGSDAEYMAALGFDTVAFDIAHSAVQLARQRHATSTVDYVQADLLELPEHWNGHFDLVLEVLTVQALPAAIRRTAISNIARLVAPGGSLLVIAAKRDDNDVPHGPPWPLARDEIDAFAQHGLAAEAIEDIVDAALHEGHRWRAHFRRVA
jgi:pimeloyl-ACP methyl ester carboxylesterase/SAM-dependent methyltransferase